MTILVTGGAGYIGSHTVKYLLENNHDVVVVDNLQSGNQKAVEPQNLIQLDIRDQYSLEKVFQRFKINAVIHFAAASLVGESMKRPFEYYNNNVYGTMCLLKVMKDNKVNKIVFSSSAAVYGEPKRIPILEDDETNPTNAYGETKLVMERMMKWFGQAYGIKYVSLRYFNAAGAHESGKMGECHNPETHLIPIILQVPLGRRDRVYIFGGDYPTRDGTCIRDYVHVMDLASAHYLSLEYLQKGNDSDIFNLGNENGYSVKEVIETARKITGHKIPAVVQKRRPGDPAVLVASSEKAKKVLGWKPQFNSLEKIVFDAWTWHKNSPDGYEK